MTYLTYDIFNDTKATRVFNSGIPGAPQIEIKPGETLSDVPLAIHIGDKLCAHTSGVMAKEHLAAFSKPLIPDGPKPALVIDGMYGIGDNLHQRAIVRELMKRYDVWLKTCHIDLYWDLTALGLKLLFKPTRLRAQAKTIARENGRYLWPGPPREAMGKKIWYNKPDIDKHGSILESMFGEFGMKPTHPDFTLPIKSEWRKRARELIEQWKPNKPVMIYRPIVTRREWDGRSRNPDPAAYEAIYKAIRDQFFVISIADLSPHLEWIEGPEQSADIKLHQGELDFPTMAALFSEASLVMSPAGFAPVLAQATRVPGITVYGGRESFRTTQRAGAHLAPTLGIDPIKPCDCHSANHACDKRIDIDAAKAKALAFVADVLKPKSKVLIFATTYVDCQDRANLTDHWLTLHRHLNPDCDLMLVDSASPWGKIIDARHGEVIPYETGRRAPLMFHDFGDNVGHLSRKGRDGWGRAFTYGLQAAMDSGYDYVVHIEGDSLFRLPVRPIIEEMRAKGQRAVSVPVEGTVRQMQGWVETGLMFFETNFLKELRFIDRYDWPNRREYPTPEIVINQILGSALTMMPWKAWRGDKHQITHKNVIELNLDWVTHCHKDAWVYDRYIERAINGAGTAPQAAPNVSPAEPVSLSPAAGPALSLAKINLGCGTNKLAGWKNHDAEVDISRTLPFGDGSASYMFAEHVVEHIDYYQAINFFKEAFRVLEPGGVLRVTVPSIEQIRKRSEKDYWAFTKKFADHGSDLRGAMHTILYCHGHKTAWTASLMEATLYYAGFEHIEELAPGQSRHQALKGVEGHAKVIGEKFNAIESMCFEATRAVIQPRPAIDKLAVVVGSAECVYEELEQAQHLIRQAGVTNVTYYVANSMIPLFEADCVAASLHPEKLKQWLKEREDNGFPKPSQVWVHRQNALPEQTHQTPDWQGSSGLFCVKIARESGFERVLLCGVPMTPEAGHVVRKQKWGQCAPFQPAWKQYKHYLKPHVRSFSGLTAELLGIPELSFLQV
jgi:SAM-dependent methyltransferase